MSGLRSLCLARAQELRAKADVVAPGSAGLKWVPKAKSRSETTQEPKERCYHFGSIGWKQSARSVWDFLEGEGLSRKQTVLVNVEGFANIGRSDACRDHIGTHQEIWKQLTSNEPVLRSVLGDVVKKLRRHITTDEPDVYIIFVCTWGKHRSVAMAEMMARIVGKSSESTCCVHHFSKGKWSRFKCGWKHCHCWTMTDVKEAALLRAEALVLELLSEP